MTDLKPGARVELYGGPATLVSHVAGNRWLVKPDRERFDDSELPDDLTDYQFPYKTEEVLVEEDDVYPVATLEDFALTAKLGEDVAHGWMGQVITEDGTVHSLTTQYAHGIVAALLFPEVAARCGFGPPTRGANPYHYQQFELKFSDLLPLAMISHGTNLRVWHYQHGEVPLPAAMIDGIMAAFKGNGHAMGDEVRLEFTDVTLRRLRGLLEKIHA